MPDFALPQLGGAQQQEFEDHTKSHVAWLVRFLAGVANSRSPQWYSFLQQKFPAETLKMAYELRQLYKELDTTDTEVLTWEARIHDHMESRPSTQGALADGI